MVLKIFVVFHRSINEKCYEELSSEEFSHLVFVAVNESVPKTYPADPKYKIIKEWELPIFNPKLQEQGFQENSVLHHIYLNKLYDEDDRVGFSQYDIYMRRGTIDFLKQTEAPERTQCMVMCPYSLALGNFNGHDGIFAKAIEDMKLYFPDCEFSKHKLYPMCNTYVLPAKLFNKIMPWIIQLHDKIYPECILPPYRSRYGEVGCYYEQIMGFVISSLCSDLAPWHGVIHPTTHGCMHDLKQEGPHTVA
jgi:hypothetical protein